MNFDGERGAVHGVGTINLRFTLGKVVRHSPRSIKTSSAVSCCVVMDLSWFSSLIN